MALTADDIKTLSKPFPAEQLGIKVQSTSKDKTKAMLICYLQHTDVYMRLEEVDPSWSAEITQTIPVGESVEVRVKLTVKGVSRENAGDGDDLKSATSDALKRAAMLFGVGRYLYDAEGTWVPYNETQDRYRQFTYQDYKAGAKRNQAIAPIADEPPVSAPARPPAAGPSTVQKPDPNPFPMPTERKAIYTEILRVCKIICLDTKGMTDWINQVFKKEPAKLTTAEMQQFLGLLHKELPLEETR